MRIGHGYDVHKLVEGRKLIFNVGARDAEGMIGEGVHIRYVVDREKFMAKVR